MWISTAIALVIFVVVALIRLILGPTIPDRLVALDTINTFVVVIMIVLGAAFKEVLNTLTK